MRCCRLPFVANGYRPFFDRCSKNGPAVARQPAVHPRDNDARSRAAPIADPRWVGGRVRKRLDLVAYVRNATLSKRAGTGGRGHHGVVRAYRAGTARIDVDLGSPAAGDRHRVGRPTHLAALGAPTVCGAETRDGSPCRKNANGILRGCEFRQHGRQKRQRMFGRGRDSESSIAVARAPSQQVVRRGRYSDLGVRAKHVIDVAGALGSCVSGYWHSLLRCCDVIWHACERTISRLADRGWRTVSALLPEASASVPTR